MKKLRTRKQGRVRQIIKAPHAGVPEKMQIEVDDADDLYRDLRIENALEDENGNKRKLKAETPVEVVIETTQKQTASHRRKQA